LLGVYAANRQSLGRFHLSVFTFDVHVLSAKVSHGTLNFVIQAGSLFAGSDNTFQSKYATHGLTTGS